MYIEFKKQERMEQLEEAKKYSKQCYNLNQICEILCNIGDSEGLFVSYEQQTFCETIITKIIFYAE